MNPIRKKVLRNFFISILLLSITLNNNSLTAQIKIESGWETLFEKSNYLQTPSYDETIEFFQRLSNFSPYAELTSIGKSPQGKDINILVVSKGMEFTSEKVKLSGKPIVLIMNGIHSGEINGKDASMILLREILVTKEKENLIDGLILIVIPIFSVDAHERVSPYNRINQIGPEEMGWRTTALNLNLNRDFMKADAAEMKAFLKFYSEWLPDIFIDVHSTDGLDFQYHTTIASENHGNVSAVIAKWVKDEFYPYIFNYVEQAGFLISPFVGFVENDPKKGIRDWVASPRFSNGYAAANNRVGLLIESHVLKSYKDRVYSTKAILESVLELTSAHTKKIKNLSILADEDAIKKYHAERAPFPFTFQLTDESEKYLFRGVEYVLAESRVAGTKVRKYTSEKFEEEIPYYNKSIPDLTVTLPEGYLIPREWKEVIDIAELHGIKVESIDEERTFEVFESRISEIKFPVRPFEGRFLPEYKISNESKIITASRGDFYIPVNQRTIKLIAFLFEPLSPESFLKWGFMNAIFEQKEYFEPYAMEPIAQKMYEENAELRTRFEDKVNSDESFKNNFYARLNFFYENSPYYDQKLNLYPVMKVIKEIK